MITDIDTYEQSLTLSFSNAQGVTIVKTFDREELTDTKILQLVKYGVQVYKRTADVLVKNLENQMLECDSRWTHKVLGFGKYNDQDIFKGHIGINADCSYNGDRLIEPKGTFDVWYTMIQEQIIGNTPLEFIIASSLGGVLVDYLKKNKVTYVENLVIHCIGESSSGKSTCALLAVSVGSAPNLSGDSFAFTFQDTLNSITRSIPCAYPTLIDEGSLLGHNDLTNMMYTISGGLERNRLSKELKLQERMKFNTVIYITSEKSLLKQCKQNSGLKVRHIEVQSQKWTNSAEQADIIKSTISENYGHLLPMFAKEVLDLGLEEIVKRVKSCAENIVRLSKERKIYNEFTERIAKQLSLVAVCGEILNDKFELNLSINKIIDFMLEITAENQETMGDKALDWIASWVTENYNHLSIDGGAVVSGKCKGRINRVSPVDLEDGIYSERQLLLDKETFVKMLKEGGFENPDIVLKELRVRKYLDSPKDRFISKINIIAETETKGYKIYLPNGLSNDDIPFMEVYKKGEFKNAEI